MGQSVSQPAHIYSVIVPNSAKPGVHGDIHRAVADLGPELMLPNHVMTAYENFNCGVSNNPDGNCLGFRPIVNGVAQPFQWFTYKQVQERRDFFGAGMMRLDMLPTNPDGMRLLGIYCANRPEWVIAEQAGFCYGAVVVPLYDTLGVDAVKYAVNQTQLTSLLCSLKELDVLLRVVPLTPSLKNIIVVQSTVDANIVKAFADLGVRVVTMESLEKLGKENPVRHSPPAPNSIATFCYTSGTTGDPKGALLTHSNLISNTAAVIHILSPMTASDVHLSYLPLPHMFERLIQVGLLHDGAAIGFYQGDTLKIVEDLLALRPTVFPSVPRLLNRMHDRLIQGVKDAGGLKQALFFRGLATKLEGLKQGRNKHPVWDALLFNAVKAKVGLDRVRLIITGSAPISPRVLDFLRVVFACPVQEGYGQTECTTAATITFDDDYTAGHVGGPLPCNEIMLADVPDMGYLSTDTVHASNTSPPIKCLGRGEICFRGPNLFQGYYKMPDKTSEAVDQDGWLHSGDIGLWLENGAVKIIDRKKNIFKLAQGEYVAPEKLENVYNKSPLIMQSFVHGDSLQSQLVAIIVPDPETLVKWASTHGVKGDHAELCKNEKVKEQIIKEIEKQAKKDKLLGFEIVKAIHLEPVPWTPDSGILTPTFKLKRNECKKHYQQILDELYKKLQ